MKIIRAGSIILLCYEHEKSEVCGLHRSYHPSDVKQCVSFVCSGVAIRDDTLATLATAFERFEDVRDDELLDFTAPDHVNMLVIRDANGHSVLG